MRGGGSAIPDAVAREIEDTYFRTATATLYTIAQIADIGKDLPPLTRRQRFDLWRDDWSERIRTAIDVLRNRHDCGEDW